MFRSVFSDRDLRESVLASLGEWAGGQRWYTGTQVPQLSVAGWVTLADEGDRATVLTTFVTHTDVRLTIPLVWSTSALLAEDPGAQITSLTVDGEQVWLSDATACDAGRQDLVRGLFAGTLQGEGLELTGFVAAPTREQFTADLASIETTARFSGEQSNTSIIVACTSGRRYMVKVFRRLEEGANPDITIHAALASAGSARIAPFFGSARVRDVVGEADVALANEFLPGVEDAWRHAIVAASQGEDFSGPARELGAAVAGVHSDLAATLGTEAASSERVEAMVTSMHERLDAFVEEVPELESFAEALHAVYDAAAGVPWPAFQRIHGDLHLGQVLRSPARAWILLDFEGEPLRSMAERVATDCPIRDVAGMLRSIDYAAGYVELNEGTDAQQWAKAARGAFLTGYLGECERRGESVGQGALDVLLTAFLLDKAAYEAVYESTNRPEWLDIPLRALERLCSAESAGATA